MAANTACNLNTHYNNLATSTQRLSSGLRINRASDDAAGLAIRELMRADIAAMHQGARNANDAISLIQTADGALGIIDEKLIRMKELAEQAATGTYDSTQRLMIESEYQAMASEITRIANATDFNGLKLLNGNLHGDHDGSGIVSKGKTKIHFGAGNDSAEDYYYISINECTAHALGIGNASTWQDVQARGINAFKETLARQIQESSLSSKDKTLLLAQVDNMGKSVDEAIKNAVSPENAYKLWTASDDTLPGDRNAYDLNKDEGFLFDGKKWYGNSNLLEQFLEAGAKAENAGTISTHMAASEIINRMKEVLDERITWLEQAQGMDNGNALSLIGSLWNNIYSVASKEFYTDEDLIKLKNDINNAVSPALDILRSTNLNANWNHDPSIIADVKKSVESVINQQEAATFKAEKRGDLVSDSGIRYASEFVEIMDNAIDLLGNYLRNIATNPTKIPNDRNEFDELMPDLVKQAIKDAGIGHDLWDVDVLDLYYTLDMSVNRWVNGTDRISGADFFTGTPPIFDPDNPGAWTVLETSLRNEIGTTQNPPWLIQNIANFHQDWAWARLSERENQSVNPSDPENIPDFWNGLRDNEKQKLLYAFGQAAIYNLSHASPGNIEPNYGLSVQIGDLTALAGLNDPSVIDLAKDMVTQALKTMYSEVGHMNFAGLTIETQEDAQMALEAINDAITLKDKTRAHLGALQNRLENTVSNLSIQAENLQASESRISDVDVDTEMTNFVRNQILTQSALSMLTQANSLPQMAMQLIGG